MSILVQLVDELHEDHSSGHFSGSIVQNRIDIALIVTHQRYVKSTCLRGILRHQQQRQEKGAIELQSRNALLGIIPFEGPRMMFSKDLVLEP